MRTIDFPVVLMVVVPLAMLTAAARGDGPPGEKELKSPVFWFRAAARDAATSQFKDRADFLVRAYEGQFRAGDSHNESVSLAESPLAANQGDYFSVKVIECVIGSPVIVKERTGRLAGRPVVLRLSVHWKPHLDGV